MEVDFIGRLAKKKVDLSLRINYLVLQLTKKLNNSALVEPDFEIMRFWWAGFKDLF